MKEILLQLLSEISDIPVVELSHMDKNTQLVDIGITSIDFVQLIVKIEDVFDIEIEDSDFTQDNFKNMEQMQITIERYVKAKYSGIKCIILDCDDVLWKGVFGEESIVIDKEVLFFQQCVCRIKNKGVLLCLCSKNDIQNISEALNNKKMLLNEEDFAVIKANDNPKYLNIEQIAKEINFSLDNILFVDDSKYELGFVKSELDELKTLLVDYNSPLFLDIFKCISEIIHSSDVDRLKLFKDQLKREKVRYASNTVDEYNRSLETQHYIRIANTTDIYRLAELSQRTNQFNLSNTHYTQDELELILKDIRYSVFLMEAKDIYGDMGIISMVVLNKSTSTIEAFSLSCRAFGRNFELKMIEFIKENNNCNLYGIYCDNQKNTKFKSFYTDNGIILIEKQKIR